MRRIVSAALATVCTLATVVATARTAEGLVCPSSGVINKDDGTSEVVCSGSNQQATPGLNNRAGTSSAARTRVVVTDVVPILGFGNDPATGLCFQPGSLSVPTAEYNDPADAFLRTWNDTLRRLLPRCPTAVITPQEIAIGVVEAFPFPAPKPYIAPGRAITGLRAFLEPRSPTTVADVRPTPLGDIQLSATGVYYVHWGDTRTGPHPGPGGPWPNGNISHVYTDRGTYDVQVTVAWTVHWQLAGAGGTLNVSTDGALPDFPVEQVQAVRNR
jgi:hypothetical protein